MNALTEPILATSFRGVVGALSHRGKLQCNMN